ncbi:tyrosine-type recombinase/integrase [Streptomyces incarnatus]
MHRAHERLPDPPGGGLVFTRPKAKGSSNAVRRWGVDQDHHVVFSRPDGPRWTHAPTTRNKELLVEAGIDDRRLYDGSRHTAGTILNELGVDMPAIMEILRHAQISQTRRYVKGGSHLSKEAMRRMGEFFVPAPAGPDAGPTETRTETANSRAARSRRRRRLR